MVLAGRDFGGEARRTNALAALAVTLLLVVIGLYLFDSLRAQAILQDCVLSGRTICGGWAGT
jgi:hypothetical protein